MIATYKLNTNELTPGLIELIQKSFPNKEVEIAITEQDETEYLLSNPANEKHLMEALERIEKREGLVDFPRK